MTCLVDTELEVGPAVAYARDRDEGHWGLRT